MTWKIPLVLSALLCLGAPLSLHRCGDPTPAPLATSATIRLPTPRTAGDMSVEQALAARRSIREYQNAPLLLSEVGQLLWAAQGITDSSGLRTAPSAGATYPLEVFLVAGEVEGLSSGVYRYSPQGHELVPISQADQRSALTTAALGQASVRRAPVNLVFAAVYERTSRRYGERAPRYVHMEVGHAAQNVYLQAEALGLGTVVIGAFSDADVKRILSMRPDEEPLYIMPVGWR
jgi:SagB-type dehydrogenase family enzyme